MCLLAGAAPLRAGVSVQLAVWITADRFVFGYTTRCCTCQEMSVFELQEQQVDV